MTSCASETELPGSAALVSEGFTQSFPQRRSAEPGRCSEGWARQPDPGESEPNPLCAPRGGNRARPGQPGRTDSCVDAGLLTC